MMRRLTLVLALFALAACGSTTPNRTPTGEVFPTVQGTGLGGTAWTLPGGLDGPAILIVGYVQNAQFDIDRWLLSLVQLETPVRVLEVPTIEGMVPGMIAGTIDDGMRSGIPSEDWASVVTVYGDGAERIVRFTGDERPRNGRVLLLDAGGRVVWFHDRGHSAGIALALDRAARALAAPRDEDASAAAAPAR